MKLVMVGFLGNYRVFINTSKEEAIKRWDKENPSYTYQENALHLEEIEIKGDSFSVYDLWTDEDE